MADVVARAKPCSVCTTLTTCTGTTADKVLVGSCPTCAKGGKATTVEIHNPAYDASLAEKLETAKAHETLEERVAALEQRVSQLHDAVLSPVKFPEHIAAPEPDGTEAVPQPEEPYTGPYEGSTSEHGS